MASPSLRTPGSRWRFAGGRDPLLDAYVVASVVYVVLILAGVVEAGVDARAYWLAHLPDPYAASIYGELNAFYYTPVVAQVLAPFTNLPWPMFHAVIAALNLAALGWLLRRWAIVALLFPPVAIELWAANINLWLAVALVVGLRHPAAFALPLLTKTWTGFGALWFPLRAEWRRTIVAFGTAGIIALASFLVAPDLWQTWLSILRDSAGQPIPANAVTVPFLLRLPVAVGLLIVAARTDRAWLMPVATVLAAPVIWPATFSILLACWPLRPGAAARPSEAPATGSPPGG